MLLRFIIWAFIIGIAYRFIARFVLPVFQVTKMTSDRIKQMQRQMQDMEQKVDKVSRRQKPKESEYIDYEEIK